MKQIHQVVIDSLRASRQWDAEEMYNQKLMEITDMYGCSMQNLEAKVLDKI